MGRADGYGRAWCVTIWAKSIRNMGYGDMLTDDDMPTDIIGQRLVEQIREEWALSGKGRTSGAVACLSAKDGFHIHMGVYASNKVLFTTVASVLGNAHVEPQYGTKQQLVEYLRKQGKWEEKGEKILYESNMDGIQDGQGKRTDLNSISEMIDKGMTPNEIFREDIKFRKWDKMIKDAYFDKRYQETPIHRDIKVNWLFGGTGTGKTHIVTDLAEKYGEDNIYMVTDYANGFDKYNGEPILIMDEFRGQLPYSVMLTILQGYKQQIHARYTNIVTLWNEVYITSPLTPYEVYQNIDNKFDTKEQLYRRITTTTLCYKDDNGYYKKSLSGARERWEFNSDKDGFISLDLFEKDEQIKIPFVND